MSSQHSLLRPVIAASWRRAELAGLDPAVPVRSAGVDELDPQSRLVRAAAPVLEDLGVVLRGTEVAVVLADRDLRLAELASGDAHARIRLERMGLIPGRRLDEAAIGTNSLATAAEAGVGVAVQGSEHYIEELKQFNCYGHPITHPVTRRLEGVLDITCSATESSQLLAPFVLSAVRRIEERLTCDTKASEQQLFGTFQSAVLRDRTVAVAAVRGDVFVANKIAIETLGPADHAVLRGIAGDAPRTQTRMMLNLSSGRTVRVAVRPVGDGVLFVFERGAAEPPASDPLQDGHVAICGEPGTGRTRTAREIAGLAATTWFDASDTVALGHATWLGQVSDALANTDVVVIESTELLPESVARYLARALVGSRARVVLTSGAENGLDAHHRVMRAHCVHQIDLLPLRARSSDVPGLVLSMTAELDAPRELRWTTAALESLAAQDWPGNLTELHAVVRYVVTTRRVGDVTVHDLPERYRGRAPIRKLTPIERAEHDAIVDALRAAEGNKLVAARQLGISRTTLYRAIRRYGIAPPASPR